MRTSELISARSSDQRDAAGAYITSKTKNTPEQCHAFVYPIARPQENEETAARIGPNNKHSPDDAAAHSSGRIALRSA